MRALIYDGGPRLAMDAPIPAPAAGEALVRVLMAGICNTDIEITRGYADYTGILGHEFVGVVENVAGDAASVLTGARVVGEINAACGACGMCRAGLRKHCANRTVLGIRNRQGAMAEYLVLPAENLHRVPEGLSDEEAVFAEPLAAAYEIPERVRLHRSGRVLVMGDGKLGLLIALALREHADVTLLGRHENKLSIARSAGVRAISEPPGERFPIVVEATGTAAGFMQALGTVEPRGTVVLKSTVAARSGIDLAPVVVGELTIMGSRCGPFVTALAALAEGKVDVRPLISDVYPFDDALEAFSRAMEKGVLKVLLDMRGRG